MVDKKPEEKKGKDPFSDSSEIFERIFKEATSEIQKETGKVFARPGLKPKPKPEAKPKLEARPKAPTKLELEPREEEESKAAPLQDKPRSKQKPKPQPPVFRPRQDPVRRPVKRASGTDGEDAGQDLLSTNPAMRSRVQEQRSKDEADGEFKKPKLPRKKGKGSPVLRIVLLLVLLAVGVVGASVYFGIIDLSDYMGGLEPAKKASPKVAATRPSPAQPAEKAPPQPSPPQPSPPQAKAAEAPKPSVPSRQRFSHRRHLPKPAEAVTPPQPASPPTPPPVVSPPQTPEARAKPEPPAPPAVAKAETPPAPVQSPVKVEPPPAPVQPPLLSQPQAPQPPSPARVSENATRPRETNTMTRRIPRRAVMKSWLAGGFLWGLQNPAVPQASPVYAAGPNSEVRLGIVGLGGINIVGGVGGRGRQLISAIRTIPGVRIVALCDVDESILGHEVEQFKKRGEQVAAHADLRRVFDDRNVDAVMIATPNHWHALATVWACQAGKDVYVEKPFSHNIWEGQQMVAAARKHGRIVQVGTQRRLQRGSATGLRVHPERRHRPDPLRMPSSTGPVKGLARLTLPRQYLARSITTCGADRPL